MSKENMFPFCVFNAILASFANATASDLQQSFLPTSRTEHRLSNKTNKPIKCLLPSWQLCSKGQKYLPALGSGVKFLHSKCKWTQKILMFWQACFIPTKNSITIYHHHLILTPLLFPFIFPLVLPSRHNFIFLLVPVKLFSSPSLQYTWWRNYLPVFQWMWSSGPHIFCEIWMHWHVLLSLQSLTEEKTQTICPVKTKWLSPFTAV